MKITALKSWIPDRVDIKRAIPGRTFPDEYEDNFAGLWREIEPALR